MFNRGNWANVHLICKFFRTSDGILLQYLKCGIGQTIIFVPGWTMSAEIWEGQVEQLSKRFRLVLLDPRSQGQSQKTPSVNWPQRRAQDLAELIAHLNRGPVVLVGWSMGAAEVLNYVDQFGNSGINGLVLVDAFIVQPSWLKDTVLQIACDLKNDRLGAVERYIRGMYKKAPPNGYIRTLVNACLLTPTGVAMTLMDDFLRYSDWRPALAKVDKPLLYVAQKALSDQAQILRTILPSAEVEIFKASAHALFVEEASRFNSIVQAFINNRCQTAPTCIAPA